MIMEKQRWKRRLLWILLCEGVGGLAGFLTRDAVKLYEQTARKPPLSPPGIVFPVVWGILYALMGLSAARIDESLSAAERRPALRLFLIQLGFNFLWSFWFFQWQRYGFAFLWLVVLFALIVLTALSFREIDRTAARLLIPYLLWVFFAGYLNFGVWMLNS